MEEELARGLVGQDEAIAVISKCIRLSRAGLRYHDRPLGVFLMIGPTVRRLSMFSTFSVLVLFRNLFDPFKLASLLNLLYVCI